MENTLPFTFERSIWREAARLKREHPELLEAKTEERRKKRDTSRVDPPGRKRTVAGTGETAGNRIEGYQNFS